MESQQELKNFIQDYQFLKDDYSVLKWQESRVTVLKQGLKNLEGVFDSIKSKIKIWTMRSAGYELSQTYDTNTLLTYTAKWPLIVNLFSACFCLGASACFHLFHIHSKKWQIILNRLDYGGICILIMGSSYPPIIYVFCC